MSVHLFLGRRAPGGLTPAEERARRDRILDAQVEVMDVLARHRNVGVAGDVELLACVLGYLANANALREDVMAMAAVSCAAGYGTPH